jgi:two-component system CheB/CheR fusion protein
MVADETVPDFEGLLHYLRETRGFDFTGYKRPSLERRVQRRLEQVGIASYPEYVDFLEVHPDEFTELFNTILINVTSFFRDPLAWEHLVEDVVPDIVRAKGATAPIRVWSAGCSSGQEPATLAMAFAKALGLDDYRDRVKIYATDVDEEALTTARTAVYRERDIAAVPEQYREYFEPAGDRYAFSKELRRSMIFGRHDVIQDAPISRVDLLLCRNVLIYFNADTQATILNRFNFALNDDGYLFLGKAEMLLTQTGLFVPADLRRRVFRKAPSTTGRGRQGRGGFEMPLAENEHLRRRAFDANTAAQVVLDAQGRLALVNERAGMLFDLGPRDVGRPFQDLDLSYRPVELRGHLDEVRDQRRAVRLKHIEWLRVGSDRMYLDVHLTPLLDGPDNELLGVTISFSDVTRFQELQVELEHANIELETAYEELQSTNEELETTNEELQSTVEELETTNEELQSTNEELETMNEELQSTNDELQVTNQQLRDRTGEVNRANSFLNAIVSSLGGAVAVLDEDLRIRLWSSQAAELWGLRADEVQGVPLATLDIGLPVAEVAAPIRRVVSDHGHSETVEVDGHDRRGRNVRLTVRVSPLRANGDGSVEGAIVFAEPLGD